MKHISLETAKALKAAGFPQEGCAFRYYVPGEGWPGELRLEHESKPDCWYGDTWERVAAPTEGELLDALPRDGFLDKHPKTAYLFMVPASVKLLPVWKAGYWDGDKTEVRAVYGETLAEALAALWIDVCGRKDGAE